jgi:hypothetical protein
VLLIQYLKINVSIYNIHWRRDMERNGWRGKQIKGKREGERERDTI